ncbi:hypothetical protein D3C81_1727970 [compost metagenome]
MPRLHCLSEAQHVSKLLLTTAAGLGIAITRRITSSAKELLLIHRVRTEPLGQLLLVRQMVTPPLLQSITKRALPLRTSTIAKKGEPGLQLQVPQWQMPKLLTLATPRSHYLSEQLRALKPPLITAVVHGTATTRRITSSAKEFLPTHQALTELQALYHPEHLQVIRVVIRSLPTGANKAFTSS